MVAAGVMSFSDAHGVVGEVDIAIVAEECFESQRLKIEVSGGDTYIWASRMCFELKRKAPLLVVKMRLPTGSFRYTTPYALFLDA